MDNELQNAVEQVQRRFGGLPPELQELFLNDSLRIFVDNIGALYELSDESTALLENEIAMVLLLFIPQSELSKNIQESLNIDEQKANDIAQEVDQLIFTGIKELLNAAEAEHMKLEEASVSSNSEIPRANPELKERLHLRPIERQGREPGAVEETAQPLTREELMHSLGERRTMADDIETVQKRESEVPSFKKPFTQKEDNPHED